MVPPKKPANTNRIPGANHGASKPPSRVTTAGDHPAVIISPVPKMKTNSKDGVVRTPHLNESQGWYSHRNVRQVES